MDLDVGRKAEAYFVPVLIVYRWSRLQSLHSVDSCMISGVYQMKRRREEERCKRPLFFLAFSGSTDFF